MPQRPSDLPDFDNPPVVEVVLGLQFEELQGVRTVHAGLLWDLFRKRFPNVEDRPPLAPNFETFGPRGEATLIAQLGLGPPPWRLWFVNKNKTQLIQIQRDRFHHNWRKVGDGSTYPRYERIRRSFLQELRTVRKFMASQGLGSITPTQWEISYINHIISREDEDLTKNLGTVFALWRDRWNKRTICDVENARFALQFLLAENEDPKGRLHVVARPARSPDGRPMIVLDLTARGRPEPATLKYVPRFLDLARDKIVRTFAWLTTDEMHKRWKRKQ